MSSDFSEQLRFATNFFAPSVRIAFGSAIVVGQILRSIVEVFEPTIRPWSEKWLTLYDLPAITWFSIGCLVVFPCIFFAKLKLNTINSARDENLRLIKAAIMEADPPFSKAERRSLQRELVLQLIQNLKVVGESRQIASIKDQIEEVKSFSVSGEHVAE